MVLITRILLGALLLLVIERFITGVTVNDLYSAIVAAIVLGILNAIVRPILVLLTLPITVLTLGLFVFVINAVLFMFASSFLEGFEVTGFIPAFLGSLIMTIGMTIGNRFITVAK